MTEMVCGAHPIHKRLSMIHIGPILFGFVAIEL
jgi:hypothetical protein